MFSGIVKGVGRVREQADTGGDRRIAIGLDGTGLGPFERGASVAVNGVCLTVVDGDATAFTADLSAETLAVTTLGRLVPGAPVNLEPALRLGDALDGHWVTGHVDAVGRVAAVTPAARSLVIRIELPEALGRYVAAKGSIAVDGVSLTVNAAGPRDFDVNVVPHTRSVTVIGDYRPGTAVNIEVDIIARYLESLTRGGPAAVNLEMLRRHGFARED